MTWTGFAFGDDNSIVDDANAAGNVVDANVVDIAVVDLVSMFWQYVPEKPSMHSQMNCEKIGTQLPPFRQFTFQQAMIIFSIRKSLKTTWKY